jgi:N,N'-diacetyllegionaminate synthase
MRKQRPEKTNEPIAMMKFSETFEIAGRVIGGDAPVYFIAEAGVAHFGDPGKAMALVDLAADAGADAFKTQAFTTDQLISASLPDWRERMRPKEVGFDFIEAMKLRCDERNIEFLCTPHDQGALQWLEELDVPAFKIGSGERGNLPYLKKIAELGKPIILSTGMYDLHDVKDAVQTIDEGGCTELALLHCVTSYPTPADQVNLCAMDEIKTVFNGPVGYSDHTSDSVAVIAATGRGAKLIEKHITLDFDVPNAHDWKVSAGPDDLADLIKSIRTAEAGLIGNGKTLQPCEEAALGWALKRLVAASNLSAGTVLAAEHLVAKRAGKGIGPNQFKKVLGRTLAVDVECDQPILWNSLVDST